jgi:hypothetical protein
MKLEAIINSGRLPDCVVGNDKDYFGNGEWTHCRKCGLSIVLRPWLYEAVLKYSLIVVCIKCSPIDEVEKQMWNDIKKLAEKQMEEEWS